METDRTKLNHLNKIVLWQTILIGWVGGVFFSLFLFILFYFQLIDTSISAVIKDKFDLFHRWYGKLLLLTILSILSIIVSIFYYIVAKKMSKWYVGLFFGLLIWGFVCALQYIFFKQNLIFNKDTIHEAINLLCLFILYGLFIGYSISFAYQLQFTLLDIEHNQYKSSTEYDKI